MNTLKYRAIAPKVVSKQFVKNESGSYILQYGVQNATITANTESDTRFSTAQNVVKMLRSAQHSRSPRIAVINSPVLHKRNSSTASINRSNVMRILNKPMPCA